MCRPIFMCFDAKVFANLMPCFVLYDVFFNDGAELVSKTVSQRVLMSGFSTIKLYRRKFSLHDLVNLYFIEKYSINC